MISINSLSQAPKNSYKEEPNCNTPQN